MVQQQKVMLYLFPIIFAVTGINFPVGVLLYWLTTNIWTMGQQFYVIRNNPQPDTPAAAALAARQQKKAVRKGLATAPEENPEPTKAVRQQPKRNKKKR
jgi:YidC/Oxa1 family membrane protein insertase